MEFVTDIKSIEKLVDAIDPIKYGNTRNYLNGAVTKLSPYISRGVISTKYVWNKMVEKGYSLHQIESFAKELGWRDFFQLVWQDKGNAIDKDMKQPQADVQNYGIANALVEGNTGIVAIDKGIDDLYSTGYMHNHSRMYTASIACNVGGSHWLVPAQWLYYHLYDADWASNALSWQWTAGAFSSKKYFANQENINKYCNTNQTKTFLDVSYGNLENIETPAILKQTRDYFEKTNLPETEEIKWEANKNLLVYNFYNLDPYWHKDEDAIRVLLLEPTFFKKYPSSDKVIEFMMALSKNIEGIKVFVGSFNALVTNAAYNKCYYKEHPTCGHYSGTEECRDWLAPQVTGYFPSFFGYWKRAEKHFKK